VKIKHILKSQEFADILKNGTKVRAKSIALYVKHGRGKEISVGIITPKRYISRAAKRNYLRRVIYSHFREEAESIIRGNAIVVRIIGPLDERRKSLYREIKENLVSLTQKAKIVL